VQLPAGRLESRTREFSLRTEVGLDNEQDFRELVIGRGPDNQLVRLGEEGSVPLRHRSRPGLSLYFFVPEPLPALRTSKTGDPNRQ